MKFILCALFIGYTAISFGQNKLSGTIKNDRNQSVAGANIVVPELHLETISDENGNFALNNIPSGTHKIVVSFIGFATQTKTVTFSNSPQNWDVVLVESDEHMDEVIVSTAFNKMQSQNVMKVEHQSIKALQQKGATTLIEGLATIPGVSQVSTGISIGKPVIRGLSSNRVLVYTQGVRLENQQFGEEHGLGLNDSGVESVEVIKGPASLLYGSDAMGGVLYFNPEKFALPHTIKANFSQKFFSNTNGISSNFGVKASSEKWKFLVRGKTDLHSDYTIANGDRVTNTRFNESDFKTALGFSDAKLSSVIRYNYNTLNLGIPEEGIAEQTTNKTPEYPRQAVKSHIVSWNNTVYFKNSKVEANAGYISNDRSEFEDSSIAILQMKLNTLNYDVKYYLPRMGNIESIFGVQGMRQKNTNFGEELLIPDAELNDIGVLATALGEWKKNTFQAGFRLDSRKINTSSHGTEGEEGYFQMIDRSFTSFNASLGYKNNSIDALILRFNLASGFRAPNLAELTPNGVHEGSNRYEIGNADLKNEQNIQADVNVEFKASHFEFFVNGFYNHINNYIFIQPTGNTIDENDVYTYVQDDAFLYGGEAGIHFHPHPFDWLHITSSMESVTGKQSNSDYLPLVPANKWNNSLKVEFTETKRVKESFAAINVEHFFKQNNVSVFETTTNDYTLLNVVLGGKVALSTLAIEFNFNINNVLNREYVSHLSRLKTDGIPNIGRNVVFGVQFVL